MKTPLLDIATLKYILRGKAPFLHFLQSYPTTQPKDRGLPPQGKNRDALLHDYQQKGLEDRPDTFVLYRIIGNDLPPRHNAGQSRANLSFILENEPPLPDCEKRFVVNRILDKKEEQSIISMLKDAGASYLHIPFKQDEYKQIPLDSQGVPSQYAPQSKGHSRLSAIEQHHILMRLYRLKNNYVMNNNGARNAALREGRTAAKWVLPWDGNCFLTDKAWESIRSAVTANPEIPYYIVPMARVTDNSLLLDATCAPPAQEEPQVLFRCDSDLEFNCEYPYGRRPKVELLWRLGVPGVWDAYSIEPWDLPYPAYADQAGDFAEAGWVARLYSGQARQEKGPGKSIARVLARTKAIITYLDKIECLSQSQ